jgi:hypothetical protein
METIVDERAGPDECTAEPGVVRVWAVVRAILAANEQRVFIKVERCAIEPNIINWVTSGIDEWPSSTELVETMAARRPLSFELRAYRWLLCAELNTDRWLKPGESGAAVRLFCTGPRADRPFLCTKLVTVEPVAARWPFSPELRGFRPPLCAEPIADRWLSYSQPLGPAAARWLLSSKSRPDRPNLRAELVTARQLSSSKLVEPGTARWPLFTELRAYCNRQSFCSELSSSSLVEPGTAR